MFSNVGRLSECFLSEKSTWLSVKVNFDKSKLCENPHSKQASVLVHAIKHIMYYLQDD